MKKIVIDISEYGKFLQGREDGLIAYTKIRDVIVNSQADEIFEFDFSKVLVLTPGYCDEVFANLQNETSGKFVIGQITHGLNVSFETVEETRGVKFEFI